MHVTSLNAKVWPEVPVATSEISSLEMSDVQRYSAHMPMHRNQTRLQSTT